MAKEFMNKKIYATGDIHGDYDRLLDLLMQHKIIDNQNNWIAGESKFVFTGDATDRGPKGIEVIELLMSLENQAKNHGGETINLLGNHDALLLARAYEMQGYDVNWQCSEVFYINGGNENEARVVADAPEIFEWLKKRPLIHKESKYLFQHADSARNYKELGKTTDEINAVGYSMLNNPKGSWNIFCYITDSRYWDDYIHKNKVAEQQYIEDYLDIFDCECVFHGHTRFIGNNPVYNHNNRTCNLDGSMSCGYRNDPDRGFIVELDVD